MVEIDEHFCPPTPSWGVDPITGSARRTLSKLACLGARVTGDVIASAACQHLLPFGRDGQTHRTLEQVLQVTFTLARTKEGDFDLQIPSLEFLQLLLDLLFPLLVGGSVLPDGLEALLALLNLGLAV